MMQRSKRRELRKLRELVHVLLVGKTCFFCKLPLVDPTDDGWQGSGNGPTLTDKLTIHHRDGCHSNNDPKNHRLCHQKCHKRHHMYDVKPWRAQSTTATAEKG